jgi:hypothetical protein
MRLQKNTPALVPWPKFTTAGFLISPKTQDIEKLRNFFSRQDFLEIKCFKNIGVISHTF